MIRRQGNKQSQLNPEETRLNREWQVIAMPRVIALYEKHGETLVNHIEIFKDDLEFFRSIAGRPPGDPFLYGVYKIDKYMNESIFRKFGFMFDIDNYDCFIEYVA